MNGSRGTGEVWAEGPITLRQAERFAEAVIPSPQDRAIIARNLVDLPHELKIRGFFFEGLCRIVEKTRDEATLRRLQRTAGVAERLTPFGQYMVRDFYKLYYHTAGLLHRTRPFVEAIRCVTQTFFPIFKTSMIGRTLTAFMGSDPATIVPIVAKAYTVSVEGNEHTCRVTGKNEVTWRCKVEPVTWYPESFQGIIEGAMPPGQSIQVKTMDKKLEGRLMRYDFKITW
ncbi:Hypothetical protein A7982_04540 [Minicystis rosea]|nr:Hypothetical protein A7982_04540 [Minicystis rosea]